MQVAQKRSTFLWNSMLCVLFFLNVCDAFLTQHILTSGLGDEANPIHQYLISRGIFIPVKIGAVFLLVLYLFFRAKNKPLTPSHYRILTIITVFYMLLVLYLTSIIIIGRFICL